MSTVGATIVIVAAAVGQLSEGSTREHLEALDYFVGTWELTAEEGGEEITNLTTMKWVNAKNFLLVQGMDGEDRKKVVSMEVIGWNPVTEQIQSWGFGDFGGHGKMNWRKEGQTWTIMTAEPWIRWDGGQWTGTIVRKIEDDNSFVDEGTFKMGDETITLRISAKRVD